MSSQQHAEFNSSTIHAVHDGHAEHAAGDTIKEDHFALARHVVEIDAATEAEALQPLRDRQVLLLDNLVHVVFPDNMPRQNKSMTNSGRSALCWTLLRILLSTILMEMKGQSPWPTLAYLIDLHASVKADFANTVIPWSRRDINMFFCI